MEALKPLSLLSSEKNLAIIKCCIEKAETMLPSVKNAGAFIRNLHQQGNQNSSTECSTEKGLEVGKLLIDAIRGKKEKRVRFFGQNISEAISILRR